LATEKSNGGAKRSNDSAERPSDSNGQLKRGARKVLYGVVAVVMGLSLFILAGPLGTIFSSTPSPPGPAQRFEGRAVAIEHKLWKEPDNPDLLLALIRQRINAGNTLSQINPETGAPEPTSEERRQYEQAANAWSEYLKATDEPAPSAARLATPMLFSLAETSTTVGEAKANTATATAAKRIVAKARQDSTH
jgi:hypothetical protein